MFFVLDENKNLVEAFDKEGFLALLQQVIDAGSLEGIDPESAVASKLRSIVNGTAHNLEFVTQAQYNQLFNDGDLVENTYYFITDDETIEDYDEAIQQLQSYVSNLDSALLDLKEDIERDIGELQTEDRNIKSKITFGGVKGDPSYITDDWMTTTIRENGSFIKRDIVAGGLYVCRIFDHTWENDSSKPASATQNFVIFYVDGRGMLEQVRKPCWSWSPLFQYFYTSGNSYANGAFALKYIRGANDDRTLIVDSPTANVPSDMNYTIQVKLIGYINFVI